jgi:hypothetical protein
MGPGSVSSLLKIGLDVFWFALVAVTGALALAALFVIVLPRIPELPDFSIPVIDATGVSVEVPVTRPMLSRTLAFGAVNAGVLLLIVRGLRLIFLTLVVGDPFQPDNVRRLRLIGLSLAGLAALTLIAKALPAGVLIPDLVRPTSGWPDLTAWFSVFVVFVLAEVFREGARLRREAELTI